MRYVWTRAIVYMLALLILLVPLAARPAGGAPAAPGNRPHLTPEQAIQSVLDHMEVGANDFRLSDMGQDNTYDARLPAVAYNSTDDEYLVVWQADDDIGALADDELEIYGQRVDAATGAEVGPLLRLSEMGPDGDGDAAYDARMPAVAYNSTENEYLVVWSGDDGLSPLDDEEYEVYAQRVDAATGADIGGDTRLSDMGPDGSPAYDAWVYGVAYNSADNEYLVVWSGDDFTGSLVDDEFEIFGQRVDGATGAEIGTNDFRLSDMGPDGNPLYWATNPAVAYNSAENEYLVVWMGNDGAPLDPYEYEVYGQRLDAATGAEIGANDFRLSEMGPDGDPEYRVGDPRVAYNSADNQYLVIWSGEDDATPPLGKEWEIYGQRVDGATGAEIGTNDFRLSDMGSDGDLEYNTWHTALAYNSVENEYLAIWSGDDDTGSLVDNEYEVYGQRVDAATGAEVGADFRLSDMGPDGDPDYAAESTAVAFSSTQDDYLVLWQGDDNTPPLVDEEFEIYGQRVDGATGAELGADQRLSHAGPDGSPDYSGIYPAVAYNSTDHEYLVVWYGDDNAPPLVRGEYEIYGQRVDAATGAEIGADFRLSDMGPDGDSTYGAATPAVAYNSINNEYLVVWSGSDNTPPLVDAESEIFGQRVDAATGAEIGDNDFRLSDMGPDGDIRYLASSPAVTYNGTDNEYLVVWEGTDDTPPLVLGEVEIFGQRVDAATGAEIGDNDFRLSDMGPDGDTRYWAIAPAVAYNGTDNEYLVVWSGDDNTGSLVDGEREVYCQRVEADTGLEVGPDLRLSDMGPDGDVAYSGALAAVAYNGTGNEYLVVWEGEDDTAPLVDNEFEIYGQRVDGATGTEIGPNDFRLSDMGPDGDPDFRGVGAAVAYNSVENEYLVIWHGDDDIPPLVDGESEIFGQQVDAATGAEVGSNDFRLSDMGPNGDTDYYGLLAAVAYGSLQNEYLVVWWGDDNTAPLVDNEMEVFGQRLSGRCRIYLPLVARGGTP